MRKVVLDIETRNIFQDIGRSDPALLDISVVGIHDSETDAYSSYLEEELPRLWQILESTDMLIGYNSDHFDIPLLNKYYPGDLTRIKSLDIMKEVKKASGRRMRLNAIAEGTLGTPKSGSGLQALQWWKNGDIERVRRYCLDDVRITKEIYDYARAHNLLKYRDLNQIRDVKLDTSLWEEREDASMTHTLPF